MSGTQGYGVALIGPFPVRHPTWSLYGRAMKISILKGEIRRLSGQKQTNKVKARTTQLKNLLKTLEQRAADKAARKDTSAIDAQIAEMEASIEGDIEPDMAPMPVVPMAQPTGPSPLLLLGGLALVAGGAFYFLRK
jgi:TolA-binding protein